MASLYSFTAVSLNRRFGPLLLAILALALGGRSAFAQATWEYSPYDIRLWIVLQDRPELSPTLTTEIAAACVSGSRGSAGYAWKVTAGDPPAGLRHDLLSGLEAVSADRIRAANETLLTADKLVIVAVSKAETAYRVQLRELDLSTQQWGDVLEFTTGQIGAIPSLAVTGLVRVMRPIAKIERVEGRRVTARLRAGGLILDSKSPATVDAGQVMQPVVRRNARNGEPMPGGIYAPAWSYLSVESKSESALECQQHSGYGSVIPTKGGPRTERLALAVKPRYASTRLELRARQPASPGKPATPGRPLAGYEVFAKYPGDETTDFVGLTDWQGAIELEPAEKPLRLFYIRNGGQLLARLPLVVGQSQEAVASVLDDDPRLSAETYIKSLQSRVMDTVARREILAVRIRDKVKKGDFAAAKKLVVDFRELPSRAQLIRELEDTQRRQGSTAGVNAKRIDKLFADGQKLLQKFLDPGTADELAREVTEAEKKGPVPASQPSTPAPSPDTT